jgi:Ca2+-dependent lipid-binding protein
LAARQLKKNDLLATNNCYVRLTLSNGTNAKTNKSSIDSDPIWTDQVFHMPLKNAQELITFEVYTANNLKKDSMIGKYQVSMFEMYNNPGKEYDAWGTLVNGSKDVGELHVGITTFTPEAWVKSEIESEDKSQSESFDIRKIEIHLLIKRMQDYSKSQFQKLDI